MRQSDFTFGAARRRRARKQQKLMLLVVADAPAATKLRAAKQIRRAILDLRCLHLRSRAISSTTFNFNIYSNEASLRNFRFQAKDIPRVAKAMGWHGVRTKRNSYYCEPLTACCIVLRRLASPCRWQDLETVFGMCASALSELFWEVLECFVENKGLLLTSLRTNLLRDRAALYADCIRNAGSPLESCVGFIDCTKIRMTRPGGRGHMQRSCYSGHKRMHCLVYQTITTPDGLIFHLYGPEVGRRHDVTLLRNSNIETPMQELVVDGRHFYLYGDAAYVLRPWLQVAFERLNATEAQAAYNTRMSAARVSVEWNYKDLKQMWSHNDYARLLKVRKAPIALLYQASSLLLNFKTCFESGGQVGSYFKCAAPTFEEYLTG